MEEVVQFFARMSWQDGVFLGSFLVLFLLMMLVPLKRLYQAYLGMMVGFFLFIFLNLSLGSIAEVTEYSSGIHIWLASHKKMMSVWSIFLIPFLGIVMTINRHITLKVPDSQGGYILFKLLLSLLFFPFLCTLLYAILENRFFFTLSPEVISILKKNIIFMFFGKLSEGSAFLHILLQYATLVNLSVIVFIVYKMTFGGIFEYIFGKIFSGVKALGQKMPSKSGGEGEKAEKGG